MECAQALGWPIVDVVQGETKEVVLQWNFNKSILPIRVGKPAKIQGGPFQPQRRPEGCIVIDCQLICSVVYSMMIWLTCLVVTGAILVALNVRSFQEIMACPTGYWPILILVMLYIMA